MVKGRRKRAPVASSIHTRSSALNGSNTSLASPLKKEIKLEKGKDKKKRQDLSTERQQPPVTTTTTIKSPGCITSYFSPQSVSLNNGKESKVKESISSSIMTESGLFQAECDKSIETEVNDMTPLKELFKTDETPVAVPCQNPPTPHRINMPNIEHDDLDTKSSLNNTEKKPFVSPLTTVQPVGKKATERSRTKLKFTPTGPRTTENGIANSNHKVTEYFPVRRSVRKCKKTVLEEKQRDLENKVLCEIEDGLEVKHFVGKGRGVVTTQEFKKGEFVVEYAGELIDLVTAKKREAEYAKDRNTGCYMYYFQHRNHQYCVDATPETDKLGRLVNHCRNGNLIARVVEVGNVPHLVLTAKEDIPTGVELNYDYGDRSRESIRNHPWLAL